MAGFSRATARIRRHVRNRKKVKGSEIRPRLAVFKSNRYIYAQVIDDSKGTTIVTASSLEKEMKEQFKGKVNLTVAKAIGAEVAKRASEKGISKVVFDRGGFLYHGRIRALAEGAREAGLDF
ncbi:50S ribosomal protein L18 [Seleniivibrio woodruffii]|uniref:Large ribosomal subunit protein uL18 n=1 Tax=Seleniivibrio woodruffii TaxID=1078050 RepID=A0A4R1KCK5_9BACT|nr:50S ribosomal protein L18 [Seleniivibrio woodruffii]TCK62224.1 LSU ribosomal protein L18P [Seleniivibrio woodruffii]TVZ34658.1 LSU ribosomal protein L18P [Seleniivibrio woodruffii]